MKQLFLTFLGIAAMVSTSWSAVSRTQPSAVETGGPFAPTILGNVPLDAPDRVILRLVPQPLTTISLDSRMYTGTTLLNHETDGLTFGQQALLWSVYAGGYAVATQVGTRLGLDDEYKIIRLESAYMYDLIAHVYVTKNIGQILHGFNQWVGVDPAVSRPRAAWGGAFGMLTYMELLNGFMPTVRLDPLDIPANAAGAYLADDAQDLLVLHPQLNRFSLQIGYKSVEQIFNGTESSDALENVWHDYPNQRYGLGYDIGPFEHPWITMFATYDITSFELETMENRFGMGVELRVVNWFAPWIEIIPGGESFMNIYNWIDHRLMIPGLYLQLFTIDTGAWSDREPFEE